jgi:hypothetical protein
MVGDGMGLTVRTAPIRAWVERDLHMQSKVAFRVHLYSTEFTLRGSMPLVTGGVRVSIAVLYIADCITQVAPHMSLPSMTPMPRRASDQAVSFLAFAF